MTFSATVQVFCNNDNMDFRVDPYGKYVGNMRVFFLDTVTTPNPPHNLLETCTFGSEGNYKIFYNLNYDGSGVTGTDCPHIVGDTQGTVRKYQFVY